ncbi:MAG: P-loop NTPase, partial [Alphaproteobacteria bacterium]|nr:P-loop NTPase [Alphaproteobacteria bacterium]
LGMIENMSYFICDGCDKKHYIFDQDGVKNAAERLDIPFLGEIPLELKIREESNRNAPFKEKDYFHYYENIIEKLPKD